MNALLVGPTLCSPPPCGVDAGGARAKAQVERFIPLRCLDAAIIPSQRRAWEKRSLTTTDGSDVRGLGCGGAGQGPVRLHDLVSHRAPPLLRRPSILLRAARTF